MRAFKDLIIIIIGFSALIAVIAGIIQLFEEKTGDHKPFGIYEKYIKRPLDVFLSTGALIVLSPVYIVIALLVRMKLGSPVLFTQDRPGKNGNVFKMYKFRTMTDERDENGVLLPDTKRLTPFGASLRSSSLDELPELFNIIRGDCAVCGPRPLAVVYLKYYTKEERHRHDVRPGLTGLAQVNGRNNLSWREKFAFDLEYVNHITFLEDVKIIFKTVKKVFVHEGIGQGKEMPVSLHEERKDWIFSEKGAKAPDNK